MASVKKTRSGTFQLRVKNKLLPKVFWATFDTHEPATRYDEQLERLPAQGIVPAALLEQGPLKQSPGPSFAASSSPYATTPFRYRT